VTAQLQAPPLVVTPTKVLRRRPHLLGELLVVLVLLRVYDMVRAHAEVREAAALAHGQWILDLETWLRIDVERVANVWVTSHRLLSLGASDIYQFAHVTVTLSVLAYCWGRRPDLYRLARNALVVTNVIGLTVFLLLPVAPPRLLPGAGFVDAVALAGFGADHGGPIAADQFGALPSLHLAWAVWSTIVVMWMLPRTSWRRLCWAYPVLVTVVVVVTGNHYLLDAVAGTAVALVAVEVAKLSRLRALPWSR
jgi:membrane-associated phospholipid phosphatase